MDRVDQPQWHQWVGVLVAAVAVLGGAVAIGTLLWDVFGIMSAPIDIVVALLFVRLIQPVRFRRAVGRS